MIYFCHLRTQLRVMLAQTQPILLVLRTIASMLTIR